MKKFTHGIMIIDKSKPLENGDYPVVHFVGYWKEPTNADVNSLREDLRNDPQFKLRDIIDELTFYPATEDCLKFYNDLCEEEGAFDDIKFWREKLN